MNNIAIGKTVSIRSKGYDEFWLQDRICQNPSILNLGDLELLAKEKPQDGGGRLDILLKEPTENTMYEVEVMLGPTDANHIVRTIEYWDREKRKYPQRQHFAVLVAETINARFFNVIHLFSHAIPIIAIQAQLVESDGNAPILHFSKILDTYEEPEDTEIASQEEWTESKWHDESPSNLEAAQTMLEIVCQVFSDAELHYTKNYISITVGGYIYFSFRTRSENKSKIETWVSESNFKTASDLLDAAEISFNRKPHSNGGQRLFFTADSRTIKSHSETLGRLAGIVKESWEKS